MSASGWTRNCVCVHQRSLFGVVSIRHRPELVAMGEETRFVPHVVWCAMYSAVLMQIDLLTFLVLTAQGSGAYLTLCLKYLRCAEDEYTTIVHVKY